VSQQQTLRNRAQAADKAKRVAEFLAEFDRSLAEYGYSDDGVFRSRLMTSVAPVVMEYAMKGIFK
jgi:hypothetical protein